MKIVEIVCKQYDEWDEATRKVILDKHRNINVGDHDWWMSTYEMWADKLEEMGYDVKETQYRDERKYDPETKKWGKTGNKKAYTAYNIQFSGFWSQGDGASYTGEIDVQKWIKTQEPVKYARILKLLEAGCIDVQRSEITRHNHRYVHERSTSVNIEWNLPNYENYPKIEAMLQKLEEDIQEQHIQLNREIYWDLEKTYEGLTSDESVADTLIANEYEMTAEGEIM